LATVIMVLSFYKSFWRWHIDLPTGCDEFGYMYMAKGIGQGNLFTSLTQRPFDPLLLKALRDSNFNFKSYMFQVAPHAYHLDPHKFKVINQYPPGTSLLLSKLPFPDLKRLAVPVFVVFIILFLLLATALGEGKFSFFQGGLVILSMTILMTLEPFRSTFKEVNSITPTFGLLIGSGYLLGKRPGVALLFLGLSTVFRIINATLVLPFLILYILHDSPARVFSKQAVRSALKGVALFFSGGLWIYILYVWILLGSPLRSTYAFPDLAMTVKGLGANAAFYFNFHKPWFVLQVGLLALLALLGLLRKVPLKWIVFSGALVAWNYLFFLFHNIRIDYYPYASAMILFGLTLSHLARTIRSVRMNWVVTAAGVLIVLFFWRSTTHKFPRRDYQQIFWDKIKPYTDCFSKDDVVWANNRSGTIEYATGKAGFRFMWGPDPVKKAVMLLLRGYGYKQAVWVSDLPLSLENVETTLHSFRLEYEVKINPQLGTYLEILPKSPRARIRRH
jgi:hypothetical protein